MTFRRNFACIAGLALLVSLTLAACGSDEAAEAPTLGLELRTVADELAVDEPMPLTDVTDFDWDTVHFFGQGTKRSAVNERTGLELYTSELDERLGLLGDDYVAVFVKDGALVSDGRIPQNFQHDAFELAAADAQLTKTVAESGIDVISLGG